MEIPLMAQVENNKVVKLDEWLDGKDILKSLAEIQEKMATILEKMNRMDAAYLDVQEQIRLINMRFGGGG